MMRRFNQTIAYLESTLDTQIDEKKFQQISGYSYALFSRLFSMMSEMTLSEYLRHRKLSKSADDLRQTSDKVIDIAIKYGYDSADAFGVAFKKFHGVTPSEVRNGKAYKVFPRIHLSLIITGANTMDITIVNKPAFSVAGVLLKNTDNTQCSSAWDRLYQERSDDELKSLGNGQSYGVCIDLDAQDCCVSGTGCQCMNYLAGYDVKDTQKAKDWGLSVIDVPEAQYAIVPVSTDSPAGIRQTWKYVLEVFFPETDYRHAGTPDFEVYFAQRPDSPFYKMELWIPVIK